MAVINLLENTASAGTVLVTGHTGFKGTWLTLLLHRMGFEVVGLSLPPDENALYASLGVEDRPSSEYFIDIRNRDLVKKVFSRYDFKYAFHLAAQPLVLESYANPVETFETNVIGTANILSALTAQENLKAIGVVTTDKVYKNLDLGVRFKEGDQLSGKDPYSASKVGVEAVAAAWRQIHWLENGSRIISLRAGNVIGGGDFSSDRLLPDIIRSFTTHSSLKIRNPESTRPWQHVLDPLIGYYLALVEAEKNSFDAFNFGPIEPSLPVKKVISIATNSWGAELSLEIAESNPHIEARSLELDSSLAISCLGWKPFLNQSEAIEQTVNWWKRNKLHGVSASDLCNEEISQALNSYK